MSGTAADEFDALRTIVKTLETFGSEDQSRILRWTAEKLGLSQAPRAATAPATPATSSEPDAPPAGGAKDIKSFVAQKKPKNDTQFAAVVAYFYRFEAGEKKDTITQADLLEACRMANYPRPPAPGQTLRNAVNAGLLDKAERGAFSINSVGENLVAVTLPGDGMAFGNSTPKPRARKNRARATKKPGTQKATAKK
jgi:hypothetical protein